MTLMRFANEVFDRQAFCDINQGWFDGELTYIQTDLGDIHVEVPDTLSQDAQNEAFAFLEQAFYYIM